MGEDLPALRVSEFGFRSPDSSIFEEPMEEPVGGFGPPLSHEI